MKNAFFVLFVLMFAVSIGCRNPKATETVPAVDSTSVTVDTFVTDSNVGEVPGDVTVDAPAETSGTGKGQEKSKK